MRTSARTTAVAAGAVVLALGMAGTAVAAPGEHGNGVGGCIDQLYGNATNPRDSGHGVLPSQSPGPWVNVPTDPENPTWGPSLGRILQAVDGNPGQLHGADCPF